MGIPDVVSSAPEKHVLGSRDVSDVIKVQNEDELRLAQMGESYTMVVEIRLWLLMTMQATSRS